MIGHLEKTVIDCPDPRALAKFYCQVPGMRVNELRLLAVLRPGHARLQLHHAEGPQGRIKRDRGRRVEWPFGTGP